MTLLRCAKCDAMLAAVETAANTDEIPLCQDCYGEEMPDGVKGDDS